MSRELRALVVLGLLLGLAWLGYGALFGHASGEVTLAEVAGGVERVEGDGTRSSAAAGDAVQARDRLVAGEGGRAVLAFGEGSRLVVEESTSVTVVAVTEDGVQVDLEEGRVRATVRAGERRLDVRASGRSFRADDADFSVARGADGVVAVETRRGEIRTDVPGAETIGAGRHTVVPVDRQAIVSPASNELLLDVTWPETRTRTATIDLAGTTEPGATVTVEHPEGRTVARADLDGRFRVSLPLREGENPVKVAAVSLLGTRTEVTWAVVRDTTPPPITVELHP